MCTGAGQGHMEAPLGAGSWRWFGVRSQHVLTKCPHFKALNQDCTLTYSNAQNDPSHLTDGETEAQIMKCFSPVHRPGTHRTAIPGLPHSRDFPMAPERAWKWTRTGMMETAWVSIWVKGDQRDRKVFQRALGGRYKLASHLLFRKSFTST